MARAPLVAFTDDDCRPAPDWLERLVEAAARERGDCILQGRTEPDPDELRRLHGFARSQSIVGPSDVVPGVQHRVPARAARARRRIRRALRRRWGGRRPRTARASRPERARCTSTPRCVWHAVHSRHLWDAIRDQGRWHTIPLVIARHAEQRRALEFGVFWRAGHPRVLLAAAGLLASRGGIPRSPPRPPARTSGTTCAPTTPRRAGSRGRPSTCPGARSSTWSESPRRCEPRDGTGRWSPDARRDPAPGLVARGSARRRAADPRPRAVADGGGARRDPADDAPARGRDRGGGRLRGGALVAAAGPAPPAARLRGSSWRRSRSRHATCSPGDYDVAHAFHPVSAWAAVQARRRGGPPVRVQPDREFRRADISSRAATGCR